MISCAAVQKLERYGSLGLKRHSTEDFVVTSFKDVRRVNIYALTLLDTWKEAVQAVRGNRSNNHDDGNDVAEMSNAPARYTDALVYAVSFAVALITQHVFEIRAATPRKERTAVMESASTSGGRPGDTAASSVVFSDPYGQALELLVVLKEMTVAMGAGCVLRDNASSDDYTKAVAHLLTNSSDLALLLLSSVSIVSKAPSPEGSYSNRDRAGDESAREEEQQQQQEAMLAQTLVLVAATAQMMRRVQAAYPIDGLYYTRPCAALLKTLTNKHKQLQQRLKQVTESGVACTVRTRCSAMETCGGKEESLVGYSAMATSPPRTLHDLLRRYIASYARQTSLGDHQPAAAGLFSFFSLFQRLSLLHGALSTFSFLPMALVANIRGASEDVQYWMTQLLSSTACNRATRYVVYFREDELRLMQHSVRQASDYALFTFATTPPVDPGLVEPLLQVASAAGGGEAAKISDEVTHTRAALVLAQWCVSAPYFFESFCQDESWASFAQEQRRLVLLQQSRARRGLEKKSRRQQKKERLRHKELQLGEEAGRQLSQVSCGSSDTASVHTNSSDSVDSDGENHPRQRRGSSGADDTASHLSLDLASHTHRTDGSNNGSVVSLASRVSLLSSFSKHSAASYLSFISVLRPSTAAGSVTGGSGVGGGANGDDEADAAGADRQMHESEDGNTNLPLILLEHLTLGLHRFMEAYPAELLDRYGLRSVSWNSIARLFSTVEASLGRQPKKSAGTPTAQRPYHRPRGGEEQSHPLFNLAQDIRYNKGMGYECLGLIFSKVVAPLLDLSSSPSSSQQRHPHRSTHETKEVRQGNENGVVSSSAGALSDSDRTEEGFFANAAAAAATVGRAVLSIEDDAVTRTSVEAALSTCLTAYETVAPQVVDMNLSIILRLAARTVATSAGMVISDEALSVSAPKSGALVEFVREITTRLGQNDDLPYLVDALLGRRQLASSAGATAPSAAAAAVATAAAVAATEDEYGDTASTIRSLRGIFSLPPVRQALMEAASVSLDPESLLLHLNSVVSEMEEGSSDAESRGTCDGEKGEHAWPTERPCRKHDGVRMQRTLLALELVEAILAGVAPTSVSASAVLEQTTQLELLLNASFMVTVERVSGIDSASATVAPHEDHSSDRQHLWGNEAYNDMRLLVVEHMRTIRQCRAVTIACLQDLGTQQVHDYLRMLEDVLWQLTSHVGNVVGSMTLAGLQSFLERQKQIVDGTAETPPFSPTPAHLQLQLLPPLLVLQRLSLGRAVAVALGTQLGPADELRDMVTYVWDCLGRDEHGSDGTAPLERGASLWLANQITAEEWASIVALGKEKHARASMVALLLRSATASPSPEGMETPAWLSRCLQCTPAAVLRALVDAFVSLSIEDICDAPPSSRVFASALRRWMTVTQSLVVAYMRVGHNPYWPSILSQSLRCVKHVTHAWRKHAESHPTATEFYEPLSQQLIVLLSYTLRSEPRAAEVLRRVLLTLARESANSPTVATLSRSGMSLAYVETIKVPATLLSDLGVPATPTKSTLTADDNEREEGEMLDALKGLTFEDELRDVCTHLFSSAFVKRLLALTELCTGSTTKGQSLPSPKRVAAISALAGMLAWIYQICVTATQASWRAKATRGDLEALSQTPAVVCLHTITSGLYTRNAATSVHDNGSHTAAATTVLSMFLQHFHAYGDATAGNYLFVHIASAPTAGTAQGRRLDATGGGAVVGIEATADPSAPCPAKVFSLGTFEDVEELWRCQLRSAACTVMRLSHAVDRVCPSSSATLQETCAMFQHLFACMWSSVHHKQHQMSKGGGGGRGSGGDMKRGRANGDGKPPAHQSSHMGGMNAFLAEVLGRAATPTSGDNSSAERGVAGDDLSLQLEDFFGAKTDVTDTAAHGDRRPCREHERTWTRLLGVSGEVGVVALWILWKLYLASAALTTTSSTASHAATDPQNRFRLFLCDYYHLKANVDDDATGAVTVSTHGRVVTALRAAPDVLRILPSEDAPPLFHEHVHQLLTLTIPTTSPLATVAATSLVEAAAAAAELLVHMFSLRPRLPAGQLLPHAHHLLVWLTHVTRSVTSVAAAEGPRKATPSLSMLCIRLCSAVAEHPAVLSVSDPSALTTVGPRMSHHQQELDACRSGQNPRKGMSDPQELLDSVWLALLSLLEDSRTLHKIDAPSTPPLLREKEVVQLVVLLTKTWLRPSSRQQVLWSRPAMLPPLMCALFTCVMRGIESQQYSPRVLNILVSGLAAMAAHVDAATANEGDGDIDSLDGDGADEKANPLAVDLSSTTGREHRHPKRRRRDACTHERAMAPAVPAHVKRVALAATMSALFEVAHHHIHVFTAFSSDIDFLFTDFLKVLSQHFLPAVARPPIAHSAGVRIGGTARSNVTFADLAYVCVGNADGKSLLKQAALRMEEEGMIDGDNVSSGGAAGRAERGTMLTDGSRSIFRVV